MHQPRPSNCKRVNNSNLEARVVAEDIRSNCISMSNLTENSSLLTVDLYVDLNEADLVRLNYRCMTDEYKTMIKLAANCALDVPFDLDIQESLLEIHKKIEDKITRDRMKEINYFILKMIENELKQKDDPLYQPQRAANGNALPLFDIREYRHFDKLLILGKMVALMEEADYMKFRKAIADDKLSYSPVQLDYIPSRYFLIKCLLEDEKIDEKLHLMYKWLDKTGCSRYRIYLEEYSKRHDFSIPKQDMITRIAIYISNLKYPKTFCSLLIILIVIIVALVVVPITYGQSYDTMKSFSSMIGANTTVLLQQECKSANELKDLESVTVSTESTSDYDVIIFLTNYTVSKVPVQLPQRSLPYPLKGRHNFGINYYRNDPIYTTGRSILSYTVSVTADDDNSTECPVEFYLFDNNNTYREFIRYIDKRVPNYINCSSLCNEENRIVEPVQEFNFSVTTPGFYFVGGSLQDEVSVNVTISAELQAYKYSSHLQPQCTLNSHNRYCKFNASASKGPMCFFALSQNSYLQNVTMSFNYHHKRTTFYKIFIPVGIIVMLLLLLLICIFLFFIFVRPRCQKK